MTTRVNYTPEEWKVLCNAPLSVGGMVAAASPSNIVGTFKEGMAIVNSMLNAAKHHPNNQLIQDVAQIGIDRGKFDALTNIARGMLRQSQSDDAQTMESCRQIAGLLQSKSTPAEAEEYKLWLLEVGKDVANVVTEGANPGGAISKEEDQALMKVSSSLGVSAH